MEELNPSELRRDAQRCLAEARAAKDAKRRVALLRHMTQLWERADQLERERATPDLRRVRP